jgi:hypothetical protein
MMNLMSGQSVKIDIHGQPKLPEGPLAAKVFALEKTL